MAERPYYSDQPTFRRKDPLASWAYGFLIVGGVATLWVLVLMFLWSRELIGTQDKLFGLDQGTWVAIAVIVLIAAILGLFFVIVARLGGAAGGGYLSADLDRPGTRRRPAEAETVDDEDEDEVVEATLEPPAPQEAPPLRPPARIDDPFGPDGRMLVSYTVPEYQPRGIYGDTWILVEGDAILNVRTLLAKTSGAPRGGMPPMA